MWYVVASLLVVSAYIPHSGWAPRVSFLRASKLDGDIFLPKDYDGNTIEVSSLSSALIITFSAIFCINHYFFAQLTNSLLLPPL
jgi:hypothetical protein